MCVPSQRCSSTLFYKFLQPLQFIYISLFHMLVKTARKTINSICLNWPNMKNSRHLLKGKYKSTFITTSMFMKTSAKQCLTTNNADSLQKKSQFYTDDSRVSWYFFVGDNYFMSITCFSFQLQKQNETWVLQLTVVGEDFNSNSADLVLSWKWSIIRPK